MSAEVSAPPWHRQECSVREGGSKQLGLQGWPLGMTACVKVEKQEGHSFSGPRGDMARGFGFTLETLIPIQACHHEGEGNMAHASLT